MCATYYYYAVILVVLQYCLGEIYFYHSSGKYALDIIFYEHVNMLSAGVVTARDNITFSRHIRVTHFRTGMSTGVEQPMGLFAFAGCSLTHTSFVVHSDLTSTHWS